MLKKYLPLINHHFQQPRQTLTITITNQPGKIPVVIQRQVHDDLQSSKFGGDVHEFLDQFKALLSE
jgi:hypothetical protein